METTEYNNEQTFVDGSGTKVIREDGKVAGHFLAKVYGYMGIGLLVTGAVAFLFSYFIARFFSSEAGLSDQGVIIVIGAAIGGLITALIVSIVINFQIRRQSPLAMWIPYMIYCVSMAPIFTLFLLLGVSPMLMLEAFGITAGIFAIMFLIGNFSKVDLSPLVFIGMSLLIGIMLCSGVFLIIELFSMGRGNPFGAYILYYGISVAFLVVMILFSIYDVYQIKKFSETGFVSENMALFGAYLLYSDFIHILLRLLYLLALARRN